jgi:hypothetical protein
MSVSFLVVAGAVPGQDTGTAPVALANLVVVSYYDFLRIVVVVS